MTLIELLLQTLRLGSLRPDLGHAAKQKLPGLSKGCERDRQERCCMCAHVTSSAPISFIICSSEERSDRMSTMDDVDVRMWPP